AAKVCVAGSRQDLEHAIIHFQNGNIERAATQIVDCDLLVLRFTQTVGQRGGRRLVDNSLNFQARDFAGIFGRLSLGVVKVGRDGDDGVGYRFTEKIFRGGLQTLEQDS